MNQGSRTGKETAFKVGSRRPEELCPGGDRASVVAKKRGNARGVKGGRKGEAGKTERRNNNPRRSRTRQKKGERPELHKGERSEPCGPGWNQRSGPNACWQPWKRGSKE